MGVTAANITQEDIEQAFRDNLIDSCWRIGALSVLNGTSDDWSILEMLADQINSSRGNCCG